MNAQEKHGVHIWTFHYLKDLGSIFAFAVSAANTDNLDLNSSYIEYFLGLVTVT